MRNWRNTRGPQSPQRALPFRLVGWNDKHAILLGLLAYLLPNAGCTWAQDAALVPAEALEADDLEFVRVQRDDSKRPTTLDVSIVRCVPKTGRGPVAHVDLIGAIHIADESYYRELNRRFADYDAVLFELVAPQGTVIQPGARHVGSVSALQRGLKSFLGLSFQLEEIDYTAPNMVHADMSPEEFAQSMRDKGESWFSIFARMMSEAMKKDAGKMWGSPEQQLFGALFASDRELRLKRIMAEQFVELDEIMSQYEGPEGSTLVSERNKVALRVLKKQIEKGKKRIAIFYGAGHMRDMVHRMIDDHAFVPVREDWIVAWRLADRPAK